MISIIVNDAPLTDNMIIGKWNDRVAPYHTSVDIVTNDVYSVSDGKVIFQGKFENNTISVAVQINNSQVLIYGNLIDTELRPGMSVSTYDLIGHTADYVKFEYCTSAQSNSKWPFRPNENTYFKQDPMQVLEGRVILTNYKSKTYEYATEYVDEIPTEDEQIKEFSNCRGVIINEF